MYPAFTNDQKIIGRFFRNRQLDEVLFRDTLESSKLKIAKIFLVEFGDCFRNVLTFGILAEGKSMRFPVEKIFKGAAGIAKRSSVKTSLSSGRSMTFSR